MEANNDQVNLRFPALSNIINRPMTACGLGEVSRNICRIYLETDRNRRMVGMIHSVNFMLVFNQVMVLKTHLREINIIKDRVVVIKQHYSNLTCFPIIRKSGYCQKIPLMKFAWDFHLLPV